MMDDRSGVVLVRGSWMGKAPLGKLEGNEIYTYSTNPQNPFMSPGTIKSTNV